MLFVNARKTIPAKITERNIKKDVFLLGCILSSGAIISSSPEGIFEQKTIRVLSEVGRMLAHGGWLGYNRWELKEA